MKLTEQQRAVFDYIDYVTNHLELQPRQRSLAAKLGVSERRINELVGVLIDKGLLTKENGEIKVA